MLLQGKLRQLCVLRLEDDNSLLQFSSSTSAIFGEGETKWIQKGGSSSFSRSNNTCCHSLHHVHQVALACSGSSASEPPQNAVPTYICTYLCVIINTGQI